jgi:hypothetical protein
LVFHRLQTLFQAKEYLANPEAFAVAAAPVAAAADADAAAAPAAEEEEKEDSDDDMVSFSDPTFYPLNTDFSFPYRASVSSIDRLHQLCILTV